MKNRQPIISAIKIIRAINIYKKKLVVKPLAITIGKATNNTRRIGTKIEAKTAIPKLFKISFKV